LTVLIEIPDLLAIKIENSAPEGVLFSIKGRGKVIIFRRREVPHPGPRGLHRFVSIIITRYIELCKGNIRFTEYISKLRRFIAYFYLTLPMLLRENIMSIQIMGVL